MHNSKSDGKRSSKYFLPNSSFEPGFYLWSTVNSISQNRNAVFASVTIVAVMYGSYLVVKCHACYLIISQVKEKIQPTATPVISGLDLVLVLSRRPRQERIRTRNSLPIKSNNLGTELDTRAYSLLKPLRKIAPS